MKLMIVESPGKVKKIQSFLGSDWRVMASVGHVRDLPVKEMGVAAPDFKPKYQATDRGKEVLAKLAATAKTAEEIYLATDPDREGEAIAWHLEDALKLKGSKRVTFGEITEKVVKAAIASPRKIDMALVAAQEGRRVLDRLVGYSVSPIVSNLIGDKLSAGRVQSPALRLVVDREREIRNFVVTTHYGVEVLFEAVKNISPGWKATWLSKNWLGEEQNYFLDNAKAIEIAKIRTFEVTDYKESESRAAPPPPFITTTLQQAASNALKFSPKKTMEIAQKLYEQGHITYMRTDSPNLSEDFVGVARVFCQDKGWAVPDTPRTWKSKAGAQEAHEAVRPTHIEVEDAGETADEKALYTLIRNRTLAALLEDALFAVRVIQLKADPAEPANSIDDKDVFFEGKGRTLINQGWKVVMAKDDAHDDSEGEQSEPDNPIPELKTGAKLTANEGKLLTQKTKPASRYSEATLIKKLEALGIGRPSTYAAILENIKTREYITEEKRFLAPTPIGEKLIDALRGKFSFTEYVFTKDLENALDKIAVGKADYKQVVTDVYAGLSKEVSAFTTANCHPCPDCGKPLRHMVKTGAGGYDFWGCTGYPNCKTACDNAAGRPSAKQGKPERAPQVLTEYKCKECGKPLAHRKGSSKTGKDYEFFGCSGYPKCKASYQVKAGQPDFG